MKRIIGLGIHSQTRQIIARAIRLADYGNSDFSVLGDPDLIIAEIGDEPQLLIMSGLTYYEDKRLVGIISECRSKNPAIVVIGFGLDMNGDLFDKVVPRPNGNGTQELVDAVWKFRVGMLTRATTHLVPA